MGAVVGRTCISLAQSIGGSGVNKFPVASIVGMKGGDIQCPASLPL